MDVWQNFGILYQEILGQVNRFLPFEIKSIVNHLYLLFSFVNLVETK